MTRVDSCTGTEEPGLMVARAKVNVVLMSGDDMDKLTRFSRDDG